MTSQSKSGETFSDIAVAIHGGAGVINRQNLSSAEEQEHREHLNNALKAGYEVIKQGQTAIDAVVAAVRYLEDCPLFNAARGAVFNHQGIIELDAAIMDGATKQAGSIASVHNVRNPITAARAVMEKSPHVFLIGDGAEEFAKSAGVELVSPEYFHTELRWEQLQRILKENTERNKEVQKFGTVGAVARDLSGNIAAATSTGGTVNKQWGRVGDSPLIGLGTYADNETCAISCTGHGEYFIRHVAAYDVAARMKYAKEPLAQACDEVVHDLLMPLGGRGGMIAIDKNGNCSLTFNSEGMFRGCISNDGTAFVGVYEN